MKQNSKLPVISFKNYQSHVPAAVPAETKCLNLIDLNPAKNIFE